MLAGQDRDAHHATQALASGSGTREAAAKGLWTSSDNRLAACSGEPQPKSPPEPRASEGTKGAAITKGDEGTRGDEGTKAPNGTKGREDTKGTAGTIKSANVGTIIP